MDGRGCARAGCRNYADRTVGYDRADRMIVVGALVPDADPGMLELCDVHADRLRAPQGWTLVRATPAKGRP